MVPRALPHGRLKKPMIVQGKRVDQNGGKTELKAPGVYIKTDVRRGHNVTLVHLCVVVCRNVFQCVSMVQMVVINVIMHNKNKWLQKYRCRDHTPCPVPLFMLDLMKFTPIGVMSCSSSVLSTLASSSRAFSRRVARLAC